MWLNNIVAMVYKSHHTHSHKPMYSLVYVICMKVGFPATGFSQTENLKSD